MARHPIAISPRSAVTQKETDYQQDGNLSQEHARPSSTVASSSDPLRVLIGRMPNMGSSMFFGFASFPLSLLHSLATGVFSLSQCRIVTSVTAIGLLSAFYICDHISRRSGSTLVAMWSLWVAYLQLRIDKGPVGAHYIFLRRLLSVKRCASLS